MQILDAYSLVKERITVIGIEEEHNCTVYRRLSFLSLNAITQSVLNSVSHEEATMVSSIRLGRSTSHLFSFSPLASSFLFYLIVVWAHCTLVGIGYHFSKTTGIVYLFSLVAFVEFEAYVGEKF